MTETATAKRVLLDFFSHFEDDAAQCDNWAEVILADLKAARVAVIELPELYPDDAPQDVVDRAKAALAKRLCPDCGDERCGWEKYDELERAAKLVPELVAEVEQVRDDLTFYREWSNDLTQYIPEEFDDDIAQEAIISHWANSVSSEVKRLREQVRQMRRQTELFMEDGDRNRLTVALAASDESAR